MWRDAEASLKSGGCFSSLSLISCLVCETDSASGQGQWWDTEFVPCVPGQEVWQPPLNQFLGFSLFIIRAVLSFFPAVQNKSSAVILILTSNWKQV